MGTGINRFCFISFSSRMFLLFLVWFCMVSFFHDRYFPAFASEACRSTFINPITDIRWEGIFPIEIAGVETRGIGGIYEDPASEGLESNPSKLGSIICFCKEGGKFRFGLTVSYWEPARIIEQTKAPFCFPTLGIEMTESSRSGKNTKTSGAKYPDRDFASFNSHYYFFNAFDVLNIFLDLPCGLHEGFDVAYISEIDPLWNNDLLAFVINPESILFGNPAAQLACSADAVASLAGYPIDSLFWCIGSWGNSYPLAGSTNNSNPVEASAQLAARTVYRNARMGILWDPGVDVCYATLTPVWIKSNYKMHLIKPVKGPFVPLGRTGRLWEFGKNPPFGTSSHSPDNFSWMLFRRVKCCMGLKSN